MTFLSSLELDQLPQVISIAGGGGKTATMFSLGEELKGHKVLLTTTTKILRPSASESYRVVEGREEVKACDKSLPVVHGTPLKEYPGKLTGCSLEEIEEMTGFFDHIIIESDGSAGRPIKAPAEHEPVISPLTGLYIGVIGLDCLGQRGDDNWVHRPQIFSKIRGKDESQPISQEDLIELINHREGLFKKAPPQCRKVVLLNKADLLKKDYALKMAEEIAASMNFPGSVLLNSYKNGDRILFTREKG